MSATATDHSEPAQLCLTRFEFARSLQVSVRTVDRIIADGEIRVLRVRGKAVRFLRSDVERYLETCAGGQGNKNLKLTAENAKNTKIP